MNTTLVLVVIVLAILAAVAAWYLVGRRRRTQRLRDRFGPEYDRAIDDAGDQRTGEQELETRARRVRALEIRPLAPDDRARFEERWLAIQRQFVDDPRAAVASADPLIGEVMEARGYPVADFEQRAADVSVDHPQVVDHYRMAHRIASRRDRIGPNTEELRQAMVHYRALFSDLLETGEVPVSRDATPEPSRPRGAPPKRIRTVNEPPPKASSVATAEPPTEGLRPGSTSDGSNR
jgi:hypothetical protein